MCAPPLLDRLSAHAPPRYTSLDLPWYQFVPGERPHPVADPQGHSYEEPRRFQAVTMDGRRWHESPGYLYGCDLYNNGFWWEAHEAWEAVWHLAAPESAERAALQGFIQLANCHLKLRMGRLNAVSRLKQSSGFHVERAVNLAGSFFMGLDLDLLRAAADEYVTSALARPEPAHDPESYPFLELAWDADWDRLPGIP